MVKVDDEYRISGGYGRFLPQTKEKRREQLWVAGGVGITPFLASMQKMTPDSGLSVHLIYCIRSRASAGAIEDVEEYAARLPQINLIVVSDERNDRLSIESLNEVVNTMDKRSDAYLCGPLGLKNLVSDAWASNQMRGKIHSERFDFRGAYGIDEFIYIGKPVLEGARDFVADKIRYAANRASQKTVNDS